MQAAAPLPQLADIRPCLEGAVPAVMATCALDGTPNVAYISQVFYVDEQHAALSFQFFNKTRENILAHPLATVLVMHPHTAAFHRLHLRYLRTETEGPVFEGMKAQLAGIASHSGMGNVFRLRGSDIYRVELIEAVPGQPLPAPAPRGRVLAALRRGSESMARSTSLDDLLQAALAAVRETLQVAHAMLLLRDGTSERLYTVASIGYATSGVGSEIEIGDGLIGVAARERTPVRISHMTNANLYSRAVRNRMRTDTPEQALETDIPYPGLAEPHSQIAVPLVSGGRVLGVVFAESPRDMHFGFEDEDALVALAGHLAAGIALLESAEATDEGNDAGQPTATHQRGGEALLLRHFAVNDSVFVDGDYLVKGVAGAILWKLARVYQQQGRTDFCNRELRLDPDIGLPEVSDNLEARLLLLTRRLDEHSPHLRIEKTGRGRFRLVIQRPLVLEEAGG